MSISRRTFGGGLIAGMVAGVSHLFGKSASATATVDSNARTEAPAAPRVWYRRKQVFWGASLKGWSTDSEDTRDGVKATAPASTPPCGETQRPYPDFGHPPRTRGSILGGGETVLTQVDMPVNTLWQLSVTDLRIAYMAHCKLAAGRYQRLDFEFNDDWGFYYAQFALIYPCFISGHGWRHAGNGDILMSNAVIFAQAVEWPAALLSRMAQEGPERSSWRGVPLT